MNAHVRRGLRLGALASGVVLILVFAVGCASTATESAGPAQPAAAVGTERPAGPTTFTAAQADAGAQTFTDVCSDCHSTSEFRGADFQYRFRRRSAWNFFTIVSETMPEDAPGSLSAEGYVSVVAYVLRLNGYEAGSTPLAATQEALGRLPLDSVPTGADGN